MLEDAMHAGDTHVGCAGVERRPTSGSRCRSRAACAASASLRYDAFEDVGGRLSFSCALLDEHGTGVVLTSINGRQETRVYAKPVATATSTLQPLAGRGGGDPAGDARGSEAVQAR